MLTPKCPYLTPISPYIPPYVPWYGPHVTLYPCYIPCYVLLCLSICPFCTHIFPPMSTILAGKGSPSVSQSEVVYSQMLFLYLYAPHYRQSNWSIAPE